MVESNKVNLLKVDAILESTYNSALQEFKSGLLQEASDMDIIAGQRFITESVLMLRTLLVEESIVQNVKDNLVGYAGAAGLGALGMKYYNDQNQPNIYEQMKQGAQDIGNGVANDLAPVIDKATGRFVDPVTGVEVPPVIDQAGNIHLAESTGLGTSGLNIWEEAISYVLPEIMESTSESLKSKMMARLILENGLITLEEAEFVCNLVDQVLTESIDEFIPDELEIDDSEFNPDDMSAGLEPMELFDADGNKYMFADGVLSPADADGMVDPMDETDPDQIPVDTLGGEGELGEIGEAPEAEDLGELGEPAEGTPADAVEDAAEGEVEAGEAVEPTLDDAALPVEGEVEGTEAPVEGEVEAAGEPEVDATAADGVIDPKAEEKPEDEVKEKEEDPKKPEDLKESSDLSPEALIGAEPEAKLIQESHGSTLLTESSDIVSRILARMNY